MTMGILGALGLAGASLAVASPLVVAHRGASAEAPENTLPAFELAWQQGAGAIEGDFRMTRDGVVVCIHDADTQRVTGRKLVVRDSTWEQLQALEIVGPVAPENRPVRIPSARQVFATVPAGKRVVVEIKCGPEIVPALMADVEAAGLADDQVVVIAFDAEVVAAVKRAAPGLTAHWLLRFERNWLGRSKPSVKSVLATLAMTGADGCSAKSAGVKEPMVRHVRQAGYQFHVWTEDDPARARQLAGWGVQSITTNVPATMVGALADGAADGLDR